MLRLSDILTRRLLITPFSEKHLTLRYVEWLNDSELMKYSEQLHKIHTLESCRRYWKSFEKTPNFFWAIEEVTNGLGHIGNINAYVDRKHLLADIGILIGEKKVQNRGYGLEAWVGVCHFLFQKCAVRKITAGTLSVNITMLRLMHKAGMIDDGLRKRHYLFNTKEVDIVHMALFKEKWDKMIYSN